MTRRRAQYSKWGASALVLLVLLAPVAARAAADPPLDVVTIEAQKQRKLIEDQISQFVSSITLPGRKESLGRWKPPICPLVAGLPQDWGEFILARVSQVARDSAAPLAPQACKPNLFIVATREPERLLEKWWARSPALFNQVRGMDGAKHFVHTPRPIRTWYNANAGCGDGMELGFFDAGGEEYPTCFDGGLRSRLTWDEVRDIVSVIMVVDLTRVQDLTIGQLADYIAMTGLAEIRENADPGSAPTILHLFGDTGSARPTGLSSWDQAFLKALYTTRQMSVMQLDEIKLRLDQQFLP